MIGEQYMIYTRFPRFSIKRRIYTLISSVSIDWHGGNLCLLLSTQRLRQEDHKFEGSLSHIERLGLKTKHNKIVFILIIHMLKWYFGYIELNKIIRSS